MKIGIIEPSYDVIVPPVTDTADIISETETLKSPINHNNEENNQDERNFFTAVEHTKDKNLLAQVYIFGEGSFQEEREFITLLETSTKDDTIVIHLSGSCFNSSYLSIMGVVISAKAHVVMHGHFLTGLSSILVWSVGNERCISKYSRFVLTPYGDCACGKLNELKDSTVEAEYMDELIKKQLTDIKLITTEEYDKARTTKSDIVLFGENLKRRIN